MTYRKKYHTSIIVLGIETAILGAVFLSVYAKQIATFLDIWLYLIVTILLIATFFACIYFYTALQHEKERVAVKAEVQDTEE